MSLKAPFEMKDSCIRILTTAQTKVSVQGVVALGSHIATFCQELDEAFFFHENFQKEKANTFTLLTILIVKSLQIELHSTNLLLMTGPPICWNKNVITPKCNNS